MSLREEIKAYQDDDHLVAPWKTTPGQRNASGNGPAYTALFLILLKRMNLTDDTPQPYFAIRGCFKKMGLLTRGPVQTDQEQMDDYIAVTAASPIFAAEVLAYGRQQKLLRFNYNNVTPGKFTLNSWIGRMPHVVIHFQFAAGEMPNILKRLYWALVVITAGKKNPKDQDARLLTWLMISVARGKSKICDYAIKKWEARLAREWPGGMKSVIQCTLNNDPEHPIVKWWS